MWAKGVPPIHAPASGHEGWHVGKENENKFSGAFGATIYMAGSY